jgi:hypothetical protein
MSGSENKQTQQAAAVTPQPFSPLLQKLAVTTQTLTQVAGAVNPAGNQITTQQTSQVLQFDLIACGAENSFALTTEGDLYSWGLNFKGQLGLGDFENRTEPCLIDSFMVGAPQPKTNDSAVSGPQTKKYLLDMLKRSKTAQE